MNENRDLNSPRILNESRLKVLRLVRAGDPFRNRSGGTSGRARRLGILGILVGMGLVRWHGGLWQITRAGTEQLARQGMSRKRLRRHIKQFAPG